MSSPAAELAEAPATAPTSRGRWERLGLPRVEGPGMGAFVAAMTIDSLGSGLFASFMLLYLTRVANLSLGRAGLLLTVASAVALAANPIAGSLVDHFGPRRLVILSQGLGALGFLGLLLFGSLPLLFLAAITTHLGERVFWVGFPTMIANMAPAEDHDRWFGLSGMIRNGGLGLGGLLSGLVIWLLDERGYEVLLLANVVSFLVAGLLIALRVPAIGNRSRGDGERGAWRDVLRDRSAVALALATMLFALCAIMIVVALPVFAVEVLEQEAWTAGALLALNMFVLTVAQPPVIQLVAGWRRTRALAFGAAVWVVAALLLAASLVVPGGLVLAYLFGVVVVYSIAELFFAPISTALGAALATDALRGRYMALISLAWGIAATVAPGFFAGLLDLGGAVPWIAVGALSLLGGLISLSVERWAPERALRSAPAAP